MSEAKKSPFGAYDVLYQLKLIGDEGVGKSSLLYRLKNGEFPQSFLQLIGVDFVLKTIDVSGKKVKLKIYDSGPKVDESNLGIMNKAMSGILIYDPRDKASFEFVKNQLIEIRERNPKAHFVLAAAKSDAIGERAVSLDEAAQFAKAHGIEHIEFSAKSGANVNEVFSTFARGMLAAEQKKDQKAVEAKAPGKQQERSGGFWSFLWSKAKTPDQISAELLASILEPSQQEMSRIIGELRKSEREAKVLPEASLFRPLADPSNPKAIAAQERHAFLLAHSSDKGIAISLNDKDRATLRTEIAKAHEALAPFRPAAASGARKSR